MPAQNMQINAIQREPDREGTTHQARTMRSPCRVGSVHSASATNGASSTVGPNKIVSLSSLYAAREACLTDAHVSAVMLTMSCIHDEVLRVHERSSGEERNVSRCLFKNIRPNQNVRDILRIAVVARRWLFGRRRSLKRSRDMRTVVQLCGHACR
jgi:hypothetical protein